MSPLCFFQRCDVGTKKQFKKMKSLILGLIVGLVLLGGVVLWGVSLAEAKTPAGSVKIGGTTLTKTQYTALKTFLTSRVDGMIALPLSQSEAKSWVEMANIEIKNCYIPIAKGQTIIQAINLAMKNGC